MVTPIDESAIPRVHARADIPAHPLREGVSFQFFRSLHNLFAIVTVEPGASSGVHRHPWEQVVHVLEGRTGFHVAGEDLAVEAGDLFVVPPGVDHGLLPRTDAGCELFVTWPFREEYAEHTAYQEEFDPGDA